MDDGAAHERYLAATARHRIDRGGPLLVSGGGAAYVATDALRAYVERLGVLADALAGARHDARLLVAALRAVGPGTAAAPLPPAVTAALPPAETLERRTAAALQLASALRTSVVTAMTAYTQTERGVLDVARTLRGAGSVLLGRALVPLAVLSSPVLTFALTAAVATWNAMPGTADQKRARIERFVREHPGAITDPAFVELVRGGVEDLDNVTMGLLGVPAPLAVLLGDHHNGISGPVTSGAVLMTLASPFGLLRDSDLTVRPVTERPLGSPAQGVAARLDRVPGTDQVRIERYTVPDGPPRYVVYVAPTGTFSPLPSREPWDLQSNVAGVSRLGGASFRATEQAMHDAGITRDDAVQFVGFSQGGLVAGMLAASGHWNAAGLETTGAPTATLGIPGDLPGIDIRNREDFVPALAGNQPPTDRVQVERTAFAAGPPPTDAVVPAHQKSTYLETARAVDAAQSSAVRGQVAALDEFTAGYARRPGAQMTVLTYHADRVWDH